MRFYAFIGPLKEPLEEYTHLSAMKTLNHIDSYLFKNLLIGIKIFGSSKIFENIKRYFEVFFIYKKMENYIFTLHSALI